ERLSCDGFHRSRLNDRKLIVDPGDCVSNDLRNRFRPKIASYRHIDEWKNALRQRPIEFNIIGLIETQEADIADNPDNLRKLAGSVLGAEKELMAEWIFAREQPFRGRLADQSDKRTISCVAFVKVPPGDQRNAESTQVSQRNAVHVAERPLIDRRRILVGTRIR